MRRLLLAIVALVAVGLLLGVALGVITTPLNDLNDPTEDTRGYVDISAEIPFYAENSICGDQSTTTGTWPFQTTTTSFVCELKRGQFRAIVTEHLSLPDSPVGDPASLSFRLSAAPSFTGKVLITATDSGGAVIGSGWSSTKSFVIGESPRFTWGHLYLDRSDDWVHLEMEIWVKGTPRYPDFEKIDTTSTAFYFDGVNF